MDALLKRMGMNQTRYQLKSLKSSISKKLDQRQQILDKNVYARTAPKTSQFSIPSLKQTTNVSEQKIENSQAKISQIQKNKKQITEMNVSNRKPNKILTKNKLSIKKQNQPQEFIIQNQIKQNHLQQSFQSSGETQKLQQIVAYLRRKLSSKCLLPNHEHNKISFICFDRQCKNRLGCSYCFLSTHQNHVKCQIKSCIQDLEETIFKIKTNQQLISKKVISFCEGFYQKLNSQIQSIRELFQINLGFLKEQILSNSQRKVISQFDRKLKQNYFPYIQKGQLTVTQFQIESKSNLKSTQKQIDSKINQRSQQKSKLRFKDEKKQNQILQNFKNFKIDQIHIYLRKRLEIFHLKTSETKNLLLFFDELHFSIDQIFSAFKKNIPRVEQKIKQLEKPDIFKSSKFNLE